jgi:hypothetical protein
MKIDITIEDYGIIINALHYYKKVEKKGNFQQYDDERINSLRDKLAQMVWEQMIWNDKMIDWDTRFHGHYLIPDAEKDKIALLRVIECTNGCIQHTYRSEEDDTLTVDEVRDAMKFSMTAMKKMEIPLGEEVITFSPETAELFTEMRRLYISGAKQNNQADYNEFLKGSKANLLAVGRERILEARRLAFNHIDELPPHTLEWGLAYIFSFAEWMPYD